MRLRHICAMVLAFASCTSNVKEFGDVVEVEKADIEKVSFEVDGNLSDYTFAKLGEKVEWAACRREASRGLVLLVNRDEAGFSRKGMCDGWLAQAFLAEGFDVLAVNRPGFGESTGAQDLGGSRSIAALQAAVNAYQSAQPSPKLKGVWGFGTGSIAASQFAKKVSGLSWIVMGNGIYDAEQAARQTSDVALKEALARVTEEEKEVGFEKRSIAWDYQGLPNAVGLYHGELDQTAPANQASAFRDSIAAQEYQVRLMILEKVGHDLPVDLHYGVMRKVLAELDPSDK